MAIGSTSVPYRSKASTSRSVTGGSHQEAGEILGARPACREVGGDAGVALRRVLSGSGEVDVNVQDGHRLVAVDVIERGARCA